MLSIEDWYISGKGNKLRLAGSASEPRISVRVGRNQPAYLVYRRGDASFSRVPAANPAEASPDSWIRASASITSPADANPQLGIATYGRGTASGAEKFLVWGSRSKVNAYLNEDQSFFSVYYRLDKAGTYELEQFSLDIDNSLESFTPLKSELVKKVPNLKNSSGKLAVNIELRGNPDSKSSTLVAIDWTDENGALVHGLPEHPINPKIGPYEYLENNSCNSINFTIPRRADQAFVRVIPWKRDRSVYFDSSWSVELVSGSDANGTMNISPADKIAEILSQIPDSEELVVLHTTAPPLGHGTLSLRPNRLAAEYVDRGLNVFFLPFSKVEEGILQFTDRSWVICRTLWPVLQLELAKRSSGNNVFVCTSFPNYEAMSAMDLLQMAGWKTLYEIRDDMEEFNRVGYSKWFHNQLEQYVAERSDRVLAVSPRLADKANIIAGRSDALVSPNAVSNFLLEAGRDFRSLSFQKSKFGSRVIGYIGHLTDSWFDWSAVMGVAVELPEYEFRIIGHGIPERVLNNLPENVIHLGPMSHEDFVVESRSWSVGLIPFKISPLTYGVDPNKLYEYLALGIRVVSAPMGSVDTAPWTKVYRNQSELKTQIQETLDSETTLEMVDELEEYLSRSSWTYRANQMIELFSESFNEK